MSFARRLIGVDAGVNPDFIKRGTLSQWGEEMIIARIQAARDAPPFILVSGNLTRSVGAAAALVQEHTRDVVYIDAQYLMQPTNKRMKQFEVLSEVGLEVQQMALARRIPVHQTVQYNREQGKSAAGDLAKIGGTDVVGQISSIVIGIRAPEESDEHTQRFYEILKNREGALNSIRANFRFNPIDFEEVIFDVSNPDAEGEDADWVQS